MQVVSQEIPGVVPLHAEGSWAWRHTGKQYKKINNWDTRSRKAAVQSVMVEIRLSHLVRVSFKNRVFLYFVIPLTKNV
jgi:hypothetical protein